MGGRSTGVRYAVADGGAETLAADLVVDASGRGAPTAGLLQALDRPRPTEVHIGIDLSYSSALFTIPDDAPKDWLAAVTHADPAQSGRAGVVNAIEDNLWIVTLCGRGDDQPPADPAGFMGFARGLSTQTIFNVIKTGEMVGGISRFGIPGSVRRYFDLPTMPERLIVLGDALCRFNPIYGQGMSVAACEALRLQGRARRLRATGADRSSGLGRQFQVEAQQHARWAVADVGLADFVHPATRGERPDEFRADPRPITSRCSGWSLTDPAVDRLVTRGLASDGAGLRLQDPALVQRVQAEMAAAAAA